MGGSKQGRCFADFIWLYLSVLFLQCTSIPKSELRGWFGNMWCGSGSSACRQQSKVPARRHRLLKGRWCDPFFLSPRCCGSPAAGHDCIVQHEGSVSRLGGCNQGPGGWGVIGLVPIYRVFVLFSGKVTRLPRGFRCLLTGRSIVSREFWKCWRAGMTVLPHDT
ncbi:hypothetical protein QBC39DRAFT_342823 [Podospora conica]|nr:hypothetical protein QBC39DRAFT_342823 [Schizothecium conicum]